MRWLKLTAATVLVALTAVVTPSLDAAATRQADFIAKMVPYAQANERATGIPSSVAIGMAALETGWGRSRMTGDVVVDAGLPTEKTYHVNTLFNIKCTKTVSPYQTGCVPIRTAEYNPDGTAYYIVDEFRTYKGWGDSTLDYGRLLTTLSRYRPAFQYKAYPDQFVTEIRRGGYATDPKYADLVISIMRSYNLYQYNLNGAGPGFPPGFGGPEIVSGIFEPGTDFPGYVSGSSGDGVRTLQRLLNARGAKLEVDGRYGRLTADAVADFQARVGVRSSGVMDDGTWSKLLPTLKRGDFGPAVSALQAELTAVDAGVGVTGTFDAATEKAVRAFQAKQRIKVSGQAAPVTWARLLG